MLRSRLDSGSPQASSNVSAIRRLWPELLVCALVLVAAGLSPRLIPHNMDEFSAYQVIGCLHSPLSGQYNDYDVGCHSFDLKLRGTSVFLPLRSYTYLGTAQAVAFVPFWALFGTPVAGRILGAVCLLFASWCIARLVRVRWRYALLASLLLPVYAMAYLEETGSASLPICCVLLLMLLMRRAVLVPGHRASLAYGAAAGLTAFVGIFMKPVFLWEAPALLLWAWWVWREQLAGRAARLALLPWRALLAAGVAAVVPLAWLLTAVDRDGRLYATVASSGGLTLHPRSILNSVYFLGMMVTDSALFDNRVLSIPGNLLLDAVPFLLALAVLAVALVRSPAAGRPTLLWLLLLAAVTFAFICTNSSAWAPHHIVFALVFVVMALAAALAAIGARWSLPAMLVAVACGCYWTTLVVRLPQAYVHADTNFDKDRLVHYIQASGLDASTVQLHSDWGTYYLGNTFGDARRVVVTSLLYWHPRAEQRQILERIRALAGQLHRDLLLVGMEATGTRDDPMVVETLGRPVQLYRFNSWTIARYRVPPTGATPP